MTKLSIWFSFFNWIIFYWNVADLKYCVSFRCAANWFSYTYININTYIHSFSYSFPTDFCIASLSLTLMIICVLLIIPLIAAIFLSKAKFNHVIPQLRSLRWHPLCPNSCFPKYALEIQDVWASIPGKRYSMSNKLEKQWVEQS